MVIAYDVMLNRNESPKPAVSRQGPLYFINTVARLRLENLSGKEDLRRQSQLYETTLEGKWAVQMFHNVQLQLSKELFDLQWRLCSAISIPHSNGAEEFQRVFLLCELVIHLYPNDVSALLLSIIEFGPEANKADLGSASGRLFYFPRLSPWGESFLDCCLLWRPWMTSHWHRPAAYEAKQAKVADAGN